MAGEPFHQHLAHGDARYLASHAVEGKAQTGHYHLHAVAHHFALEAVAHGVPFDERTCKHQRGGHGAREADAKLVQDDAADEEQTQEDVEKSVRAAKESVFVAAPSQPTVFLGGCEQGLQG